MFLLCENLLNFGNYLPIIEVLTSTQFFNRAKFLRFKIEKVHNPFCVPY